MGIVSLRHVHAFRVEMRQHELGVTVQPGSASGPIIEAIGRYASLSDCHGICEPPRKLCASVHKCDEHRGMRPESWRDIAGHLGVADVGLNLKSSARRRLDVGPELTPA